MIGIRVILHEWFLGIITDCMQFIDRIVLEWFLFLYNVYWMNMGWMCEDCVPWRWTVSYWKKGKEEKRTLDSNPFNDMYSIFMPSMIMIMRIEWERIKMGWDWDWLWFGIGFDFCIHNWKWMSNAQIWFRNGCGLWLGLVCYIWLHYWCWQRHSV